MGWKHDDLAEDLAAHLRSNTDRMVWTDMQLGPVGSPRPDVYAMPKSYSKFMPVAYECKISVADFRRDITAGKWASYLKFAAGVVFCVPAGLVSKADIPIGCGLMVRNEDGWRTLKGPTMRSIENLPLQAWMKMLLDGVERHASGIRVRAANEWAVETKVRAALGDAVADALHDHHMGTLRLATATAALKRATQDAEKERERLMKEAREHAERESGRIDSARVELCEAIGVAHDASSYVITARLHELRKRLDESAEIQRLRFQLEKVRGALDLALAPLPEFPPAAARADDQHIEEML